MLDFDLAELYEVETKVLNRAVKKKSQTVSRGFRVSVGPEETAFEVPIWHLKDQGRPPLPALLLRNHKLKFEL